LERERIGEKEIRAYGEGLTDEGVRAALDLLRRDKSELPNHALAITKTIPSKSSYGKDK
jgi:hypothetical protein